MAQAHYFAIGELGAFLANLETARYAPLPPEPHDEWLTYAKDLSGALRKFYSYHRQHSAQGPVQIRVTYKVLDGGRPLKALADRLKGLNANYLDALTLWKTKKAASSAVRRRSRRALEHFLSRHSELISCFRYRGDSAYTEGNFSFNMQIASTPKERAICFEFVQALLDAYAPEGVTRSRRQIDKPRVQRDSWIKRYAALHKRRGWTSPEIVREIQRELREGTWNERSRLQYNLAVKTIGRIAGLRILGSGLNN